MNNFNKLIWSKGPFNNIYSKKATEEQSNKTQIIDIIENANNVVWIRNGSSSNVRDLDIFAINIDKLKNPIILVTSDGDRPVPNSYDKIVVDKILNNNKILRWYTQNYDMTIIHPKLKHYPIGFDFHTTSWLIYASIINKLKYMIISRSKSQVNKRISNKIFSDSHHSISHRDRAILYKTLKNNRQIVFSDTRYSFIKIIQEYNKYNFVLSPRGRGLDCHRTWELLLLGVIVITKTSSLDEMYISNKLPVVIIKDWDELNSDLDDKLKKWYDLNINFTSLNYIYPKLLFNYWLK
jgi:hypothetical protein